MTRRDYRAALALALTALLFAAGRAQASGGNYTFDGGTAAEQQQVRLALAASAFNWSAVPAQITITIEPNVISQSVQGHIWLDSNLLDAGEFSWGVVQNEYGHQVNFFLLNDAQRAQLTSALGAIAWCYGDEPGLTLAQAGCERFASTLAVAYWPTPDNCIESAEDVAPIAPTAFRALLATMIGAAATPTHPLATASSSRRARVTANSVSI
jgi:hypothetical protein